MSTKDNEPQVIKLFRKKIVVCSLFLRSLAPSPSSSWRSFTCSLSCSRKIAPVSDARAELFRVSEINLGGQGRGQPKQKMGSSKLREYQGSNFLRQRLVLATITSTPVRISNIRLNSNLKMALLCSLKLFRPRDDDPGLQEAEGGFIRLLDRLTNGSQVNW